MFKRKNNINEVIKNSIQSELNKFQFLNDLKKSSMQGYSTANAEFETFIYAVLNTRAEVLSRGIPVLYRLEGNKQKPVNSETGFIKLLKNPNNLSARQTLKKMLAFISLNLDIYGNCLYRIQRLNPQDPLSKITQLVPLLTENVMPVYRNDGTAIDYYQYSFGSNIIKYLPSEILHFKITDINNLLWGRPTIACIKTQINIDYLEHKYLENYYRYDGTPNAIVETEKKMDEDEIKLFRKRWWERFRDWSMRSVPIVLSNGNKYVQTQKDPKQNNLVETRKLSKEDIMTALKMPPIVMGMTTMNYANATAGLITLIENAIKPFCELNISSEFERFGNENFNTNYVFSLDYDLLYDMETLIKLWNFLITQGIATRNEIREEQNRAIDTTDPRMNQFMIPNNVSAPNEKKTTNPAPGKNNINGSEAELLEEVRNFLKELKKIDSNYIKQY